MVFDRVVTGTGASKIWTLNLPGTPTLNGNLISYVSGANRLDVRRVAPTNLTSTLAGRRVEVTDSAAGQSLFLNVLGTNGSVSNAVASNGTDQTGTQITLADGRTATVRFSNSGTGGTLELPAFNGARCLQRRAADDGGCAAAVPQLIPACARAERPLRGPFCLMACPSSTGRAPVAG